MNAINATAAAATHRVDCAACAAPLVAVVAGFDSRDCEGRPVDALATVVRHTAESRALPVLPGLVWFTCPACDHWQR